MRVRLICKMTFRPILFALWAAAAPIQTAQAQDELLGELAKCTAIAQPAPRLACYDALAPKLHAATANTPEDLSKQDRTSLFGLDLSNLFGARTPQQFGAERLPQQPNAAASAPEAVDSITAGVTEYSFNPLGRFVVFLDNGQIWRQLDADTGRAIFASGNMVTISRGAFGSYNLRLVGQNALFKVRRVK